VPTICPRFFPILLLLAATALSAPPKVSVDFSENGISSLRCNNAQFLKRGDLRVGHIYFQDDNGKDVPADVSNPTISFERSAQRLSHSWPWGAVRCRYTLAGQRLNLELTIQNDTAGPMSGFSLDMLELQMPRGPTGIPWERRYPLISENNGEMTAFVADYGTGQLVFCNDDPGTPLRSGIAPDALTPRETWSLPVASPTTYGEAKVVVQPRSQKTFHFSLRFAQSGVPLKAIVGDLMEKFAAAHPFQLRWPDRRPIGMLTLASPAHSSPTNPRGWLGEATFDFNGSDGATRFRARILEAADRSIGILQDMGAQGMIFWDLEGEEFPNINYVGDPRMTAQLAPEMEAAAPEFFARFHRAGLRTGVCIRPSRIVPAWDGKTKWVHDHMGFDVVEEMIQKIAYAKKRLGCLLFYVDSNVRWYLKPDGSADSHLLEVAAFKRLAEAHPDVLIIPEIPQLAYWSCTAPYQDLRPGMFGGHAATASSVLDVYPRAFSLINPIDGPAQERRAEIVAGQRRGDLLLFCSWYSHHQNKLFKVLLQEALQKK
jgi:hypothetical protein